MILSFETSTNVCSVAYQNKEGQCFEKRIQGRSVHSDSLFLFTRQLANEHQFNIEQIEQVLVSNGPGSYTGLRIAASALKGLFFDSDATLYAVNTLAGFAASQMHKNGVNIHAIIDARRTHVYHQKFSMSAKLESQSEMNVVEIEVFEQNIREGDIIVGTGIHRLSAAKVEKVETYDTELVNAKNLIHLFNHQPMSEYFDKTNFEDLNPNYITSSQVNNSNI